METYQLKDDIRVFSITAESFPAGIEDAFQDLRKLLPTPEGREFFGVSRPNDKGEIIYKAAVAEAYSGEAEKCRCETFVIPKGEYLGKMLNQYRKDITLVDKTFKVLLASPRIDTNGFCLEAYLSEDDVVCMVPLARRFEM